MLVGYARVPTIEQYLHLQRGAPTHVGCDRVFTDHPVDVFRRLQGKGAECEERQNPLVGDRREGMMAIRWMCIDQVVELSGVPEQDEAALNPFGLIGYELVAVTTVAAAACC